MRKWKDFERETVKRICGVFDEPYQAFKTDKNRNEKGSCRTPQGTPGGDMLKSERMNRLFPFTVEMKACRNWSTLDFGNWILQTLHERVTNEHILLIIHKHNSGTDAAIIESEICNKLVKNLDVVNYFTYKHKKFSTKRFWSIFEEANKSKNAIITFKSEQLNILLRNKSFSILDFELFLNLVHNERSQPKAL